MENEHAPQINEEDVPRPTADLADDCAAYAQAICRDLTGAQPYFRWWAAVIAQTEWSPEEEESLRLAVQNLTEILSPAGLGPHDNHVLSVTASDICDKHEARNALGRTVEAARSVLTYAEIREIVTAAELTQKGTKVEVL